MAGLGELEREVMDRLWAAEGPLTVRQVHELLSVDRTLAYTTVMTVLDRLSRKDLARRERRGRAFAYIPAHTRDELTASLMREALESAGENRTSALVHFAETATAEEAAALRDALTRMQRRAPKR